MWRASLASGAAPLRTGCVSKPVNKPPRGRSKGFTDRVALKGKCTTRRCANSDTLASARPPPAPASPAGISAMEQRTTKYCKDTTELQFRLPPIFFVQLCYLGFLFFGLPRLHRPGSCPALSWFVANSNNLHNFGHWPRFFGSSDFQILMRAGSQLGFSPLEQHHSWPATEHAF